MSGQSALAHEARLRLTGWASPDPRGLMLGGLLIRLSAPLAHPARVTLSAYPRTSALGELRYLNARTRSVREAHPREANAQTFVVTGKLLRASRGSGLLQVKVCPAQSRCEPFVISMHATSALLDTLDPAAFAVRVQGRVLSVPGGLLLAEHAEVVHAPSPEHWRRHRPRRRASSGLLVSPESIDSEFRPGRLYLGESV